MTGRGNTAHNFSNRGRGNRNSGPRPNPGPQPNSGQRQNDSRNSSDHKSFPVENRQNLRVPFEEWPSAEEALAMLQKLAPVFLGVGAQPMSAADLPPTVSKSRFPQFWLTDNKLGITQHDLNTARRDGTKRQMTQIFALLTNGMLRCHKSQPSVILVDRASIIKYSRSRPDIAVSADEAQAFFWASSEKAVLILNRSADNTSTYTGEYRKLLPSIGAKHSPTCACSAAMLNNSLPYSYYSTICVPAILLPEPDIRTVPETRYALNETPCYLNRSILFAGPVSTAATATPLIALRQPLARLKREAATSYKISGSSTNLLDKPALLRKLCAELHKPDFRCFTRFFTKDNGDEDNSDFCRFPNRSQQYKSVDIQFAQTPSMDYLLSNAVHVSPFHGLAKCPFCDDTIVMKGIRSLVTHIVTKHRRLKTSVFTCPACVVLSVTKWDSYTRHFDEVHHASTGLLCALYEHNTHSRMAYGVALSAVVTMTAFLPNADETCAETPFSYSLFGGYAPLGEGQDALLLQAIVALQREILPSDVRNNMDEKASTKLATKLIKEEATAAAASASGSRNEQDSKSDTNPLSWVEVAKRSRKPKLSSITVPLGKAVKPQPLNVDSSTAQSHLFDTASATASRRNSYDDFKAPLVMSNMTDYELMGEDHLSDKESQLDEALLDDDCEEERLEPMDTEYNVRMEDDG